MTTHPVFDPHLRDYPEPDPEVVRARLARLRELNVDATAVPEFDEFAAKLAQAAQTPYAMVNIIGAHEQFFTGLHVPTERMSALRAAQAVSHATPSRTMPLDHGYCPHVIEDRKAWVLGDVCAYPRFAGNPVVNELGVRAYIGAPLLDPETGLALGTVCAVSTARADWGKPGVDMIKSMAREAMDLIIRVGQRR